MLEPGVTSKTRNGIVRFLQVVADAQSYEGDLADVVEMIADKSGLIDALRAEGTEEAQDRVENIREFFGVVKEYVANHEPSEDLLSNAEVQRDEPQEREAVAGDLNLAGFMEWLALRTDLDSAGEGESAVTLMTVHAAKGLEFNTVFVAGMEEGVFPHVNDFVGTDPAKLEEERRLAYVAITRARRKLYLTHAESRRLYGDVQHNRRSRFVDEILRSTPRAWAWAARASAALATTAAAAATASAGRATASRSTGAKSSATARARAAGAPRGRAAPSTTSSPAAPLRGGPRPSRRRPLASPR